MNIKDLFNVIKFLKKNDSCIILRNDLQLGNFGKFDDTMLKFHNEINSIIKNKFNYVLRNIQILELEKAHWTPEELAEMSNCSVAYAKRVIKELNI